LYRSGGDSIDGLAFVRGATLSKACTGCYTFGAQFMSLPQEQFRVTIDAFDGPLDLLLYLVQRAEVDVQDIPIANITDEYLEVLRLGIAVDVELAGEFLVMAATLIEIKSRSLVPEEDIAKDDQEIDKGSLTDPRTDLIHQLLAFQRFRTASEHLEDRRIAFERQFDVWIPTAKQTPVVHEHSLELDDVHILDLSDAYEHIASSIDFSRLGEHHISFDDIPIELCQEDLLDQLRRADQHQITLHSTFRGRSMSERVGMFLATLELVRLRLVTVQQDLRDGDIVIALLHDGSVSGELNDESI